MRIRTVKPDFWTHPVMSRQADHAQLIALGLLNYADDHGYFFADPKLVRSALRPLDDDSTNVRRSLDDLSRIGFIELREHPSHGLLGRIASFVDHQRVDRPKDSSIKALFDSTNVRRLIDDESSLEGKGREGNNTCAEKSAVCVPEVKAEAPAHQPKAERKRDPLFDALAKVSGHNLDSLTQPEGGRIAKALSHIKAASPEVTPEEIYRRAANYRSHNTSAQLTPTALSAQWSKCDRTAGAQMSFTPVRIAT